MWFYDNRNISHRYLAIVVGIARYCVYLLARQAFGDAQGLVSLSPIPIMEALEYIEVFRAKGVCGIIHSHALLYDYILAIVNTKVVSAGSTVLIGYINGHPSEVLM